MKRCRIPVCGSPAPPYDRPSKVYLYCARIAACAERRPVSEANVHQNMNNNSDLVVLGQSIRVRNDIYARPVSNYHVAKLPEQHLTSRRAINSFCNKTGDTGYFSAFVLSHPQVVGVINRFRNNFPSRLGKRRDDVSRT